MGGTGPWSQSTDEPSAVALIPLQLELHVLPVCASQGRGKRSFELLRAKKRDFWISYRRGGLPNQEPRKKSCEGKKKKGKYRNVTQIENICKR